MILWLSQVKAWVKTEMEKIKEREKEMHKVAFSELTAAYSVSSNR